MYRLASQKAPGQGTVYRVADITHVRRALEPDPKVPLFGGTENLRKGLPPKEAGKAFILDMADNRTIDLVATTEAEVRTRAALRSGASFASCANTVDTGQGVRGGLQAPHRG
jgi:hypothetical protein